MSVHNLKLKYKLTLIFLIPSIYLLITLSLTMISDINLIKSSRMVINQLKINSQLSAISRSMDSIYLMSKFKQSAFDKSKADSLIAKLEVDMKLLTEIASDEYTETGRGVSALAIIKEIEASVAKFRAGTVTDVEVQSWQVKFSDEIKKYKKELIPLIQEPAMLNEAVAANAMADIKELKIAVSAEILGQYNKPVEDPDKTIDLEIKNERIYQLEDMYFSYKSPAVERIFAEFSKYQKETYVKEERSVIKAYSTSLNTGKVVDKEWDTSYKVISSYLENFAEAEGAYYDYSIGVAKNKVEAMDLKILIDIMIASIIVILATTLIIMLLKNVTENVSKLGLGIEKFIELAEGKRKEAPLLEIETQDEIGDMARSLDNQITVASKGIIADSEFMVGLKFSVEKIKQGNFEACVKEVPHRQELVDLRDVFNSMLLSLQDVIGKDINTVFNALTNFSNLNFRQCVLDEKAHMILNVNNLSVDISNMLVKSIDSMENVEDSAQSLTKEIMAISANLSRQAASLEETAASMEETTGNVNSNYDKTQLMASHAAKTEKATRVGMQLAQETVEAMADIDSVNKKISDSISVIDQIAFQTNILSLNAAVEAATAGEHGKGFAVVAAEVRSLASKSAEAAKQIKGLVNESLDKSKMSTETTTKMLASFNEIKTGAETTKEIVEEVAQSQKEQLEAINQINSALTQIEEMTHSSVQSLNTATKISDDLTHLVEEAIRDSKTKLFYSKAELQSKGKLK